MASPEILRHSVTFDEERVFRIVGIPREMEVSNTSTRFDPRTGLWAEATKQRYGDKVVPVVTDKYNGHGGGWIQHEGVDWQTGESFCTYHVVCACAGGVEGNSPLALVEKAANCDDMRQMLQRRAAYVDHTFRTREILSGLRDPDISSDVEQPARFHDFARRSIVCVLILDASRPAEWPGNLVHGQHQASILATMLQLHPDLVRYYVTTLQENNVVDFDGDTLSFTEQTVSDLGLQAA